MAFSTKIKGSLHLQGNVQVYVRIPVSHVPARLFQDGDLRVSAMVFIHGCAALRVRGRSRGAEALGPCVAQPMASHFGVDEHPFATYFDVYQGFVGFDPHKRNTLCSQALITTGPFFPQGARANGIIGPLVKVCFARPCCFMAVPLVQLVGDPTGARPRGA